MDAQAGSLTLSSLTISPAASVSGISCTTPLVVMDGLSSISLSSIQFVSCSCTSDSTGLVYCEVSDDISTLQMESLTFDFTAESHNHSIYIQCIDGTAFLPDATFTGTISPSNSSSDTQFVVVESGRDISGGVPLYHFLFPPSQDATTSDDGYTIFVSAPKRNSKTLGTEIDSCGWIDVPCLSIHTAHQHIGSKRPLTLSLLPASSTGSGHTHTAESEQTTFSTGKISIAASDGTALTKPLQSLSSVLYICSATSVAFTSITFSLDIPLTGSALASSIFSVTAGSLTLSNAILAPDSLVTISAPIIIVTSGADAELKGCTFANLSLTSVDGGSVIRATLGDSHTLKIVQLSTSRSSFTKCSTTSGNGGAMHITLAGEASKLHITGGPADAMKNLFSECSASAGHSGALFVDIRENHCLLEVTHTLFTDCTCSASQGQNLLIYCEYPNSLITRSRWRGTIDSYNEEYLSHYWVLGHPDLESDDGQSVLDYLYTSTAVTIYVASPESSPAGSDTYPDDILCGEAATPCETVDFPFTNINRAAKFILLPGTHTPEPSSVVFQESFTYELDGSSVPVKQVSSIDQAEPVFVVKETAQLTVTSLKFNLLSDGVTSTSPLFKAEDGTAITHSHTSITSADEENSLTASLIDTSGGILVLQDVQFSDITLANAPLLAISTDAEDSFTLDTEESACLFTDISRTTGSGVIFSIPMTGSAYITISHATFTRCRSIQNADVNAAIFVELSAADDGTTQPSVFKLTDLAFDECTLVYPGQRNIHIACVDAAELITPLVTTNPESLLLTLSSLIMPVLSLLQATSLFTKLLQLAKHLQFQYSTFSILHSKQHPLLRLY